MSILPELFVIVSGFSSILELLMEIKNPFHTLPEWLCIAAVDNP